jgi:hypothetical protein
MKPRKVDRPLVLYGKGNLGKLAKEIFYELGIRPAYVMDKMCSFEALPKDVLVAVCVATEPYYPIAKTLNEAGWEDVVPVWDIIEAYPEVGISNGWFAGKLTVKDKNRIRSLYWDDASSCVFYNSFLEWRINRRESCITPINKNAYKCLPSTLADIRARQKVLYINEGILVDLVMDRIVSIHCEGYELNTIRQNMHLFKKYRPKIEVACYHSRDGLWKIEKYLMDNLKDYEFTFRLHAYQGQAAYMYCKPKEKI